MIIDFILNLHWQKGEGPYNRKEITTGVEMIDKWKVISSRSGHEHAGDPGKGGKRRVLSKIEVLPPGTICTETYLVIGAHRHPRRLANNLLPARNSIARTVSIQNANHYAIIYEKNSYQWACKIYEPCQT